MTKFKKILLILLVPAALLAAATGTFIYANKVVGIYSQENFVDGDFEKSTYGAILSGTVGSTSLSITNDPSVYGNALQVTSPAAGLELLLGIDGNISGLKGLNCEARTNLYLVSANLTPMTLEVDVVRGTSLRISNMQAITLSKEGWVPVSVNFPCSAVTSASYIRVKVVTTGTVASGDIIFNIDSVYAGEATNITNQVVVTDEVSYIPATSPGLGTLSNVDLKYWRVGSKLFVRGAFTTGTTSGSEARLDLPLGLTTKADTVQNTIIGVYGRSASATAHGGFIIKQNNVNYVLFSQANTFSGTSSIATNPDVGTTVAGTGEKLSVEFSVEINGWSATQSAITQQCIQDGSCENVFSAQVSSGGVVSGENIDFINGNCSGSSPYTCTFNTNFFSAAPNCEVTPISSVNTGGTFNALTTASQVFPRTKNDGSGGNENHAFSLVCQRASTDYKPRFAAPVLVGSVTSNSTSAERIDRMIVAGAANRNTSCTTTPCTVFDSNNGTPSCTRGSTGIYFCSFGSSFSVAPSCTIGNRESANNTYCMIRSDSPETTSGVGVRCLTNSSTLADGAFSLTCIGAR